MKLFICFCLIFILSGCAIQPNLVRTNRNIDVIDFAKLVARNRSNSKTEFTQHSPCKITVPVNCKFGNDTGPMTPYVDHHTEKKIINDFETFCTENENGIHKHIGNQYKCLRNDGSPIFTWNYSKKVRVRSRVKSLNSSLHVYGTIFINIEKMPIGENFQNSGDFLSKIEVRPVVKDKSGFYAGEKLVTWKKKINQIDCMAEHKNVKYSVKIIPIKSDFLISLKKDTFLLEQNSKKIVEPTIIVNHKMFNVLHPSEIYENDDISIIIKKITSSPTAQISVLNKSNKFVTIDAFSLYINDVVLTKYQTDINHELPPKVSKKIFIDFKDAIKNNHKTFYKLKKDINIAVDRNMAKNTSYRIGVSVKYKIDNKVKTLFKYKNEKLLSLLSLN